MGDELFAGAFLGFIVGAFITVILFVALDGPHLWDEHRDILWEHCYTQYETPSEVRDCLTELGLAVE